MYYIFSKDFCDVLWLTECVPGDLLLSVHVSETL
jgi:hypothetical protein